MLRRFADTPLAIVTVLFNCVALLMMLRFTFLLLAANAQHWIARTLYALTDPLVRPFQGLFRSVAVGNGILEWASVVAIIVYAALAILVLRLLAVVAKEAQLDAEEERAIPHAANHRRHSHA